MVVSVLVSDCLPELKKPKLDDHNYLKKKSNKSTRNYFDFAVNKMGHLTEQDLGTLSERYSQLSM